MNRALQSGTAAVGRWSKASCGGYVRVWSLHDAGYPGTGQAGGRNSRALPGPAAASAASVAGVAANQRIVTAHIGPIGQREHQAFPSRRRHPSPIPPAGPGFDRVRTRPIGQPVRRCRSGHQAVARAGTEIRADIHAGRQCQHPQSTQEGGPLLPQTMELRKQPQPELRAGPNQQHIEHRAQAWLLPDRESTAAARPGRSGWSGRRTTSRSARHALGQYVPWRDADAGAHHQADAYPIEEQSQQQL